MKPATVRIPSPLRSFTGGEPQLSVQGATVGEVLDALVARHAGLGERILDDTGHPDGVTLFVGSRDARRVEGRDTVLDEGSILTIVPRVHGS